jgi:hypothetical protein
MGKYDAIRGAGNVTVQAPPDFWTSVKQSFDDDYDRLVAAQERKNIKEQQSIDNNRAERQLNMQEEQADMMKEAEDRRQFDNELSLFTDPAEKAEWAKRIGVSRGWISREKVEEWETEGISHKSYKTLKKDFLAGDDEQRARIYPELMNQAFESNQPAAEIKLWEGWGKEATKSWSNRETAQMFMDEYGENFTPALKSYFEDTKDVTDEKLKFMVNTYLSDQKIKDKTKKEKADIAQSFMEQWPLETDTKEVIASKLKMQQLGRGMMEEIGYIKEEKEVKGPPPRPTLGAYDKNVSGLHGSFDALEEDEKSKIFKEITSSVLAKYGKEWGDLSGEEMQEAGDAITRTLNETDHAGFFTRIRRKDDSPDISLAGVSYKDAPRAERSKRKMLERKLSDTSKKQFGDTLTKEEREYIKETGQVPERMLIPDKISELESLLKEDYKSGADKSKEERKSIVENQEKEINNLVMAISKIKNEKSKKIIKAKLNDMLSKRQKDYAMIRKGLGLNPKAQIWMFEPATEPIDD